MEGWIKLHRGMLTHWLYDEYRPLTRREAWENIIMWANFKADKALIHGQLIDCDRGQLLYSIETYSKKFVWSVGQVKSFFKLLENDGMIKLEGLKYTTRLTICNYDKYQDLQLTESELRANSELTESELTTNSELQDKNEKKEKNEKNEKKKKDFVPPTFEEIEIYFKENGFDSMLAKRFFQSYSVANWVDSKGNKIKNWKQKAVNVWFREGNKPKIIQQTQIPQRKANYLS